METITKKLRNRLFSLVFLSTIAFAMNQNVPKVTASEGKITYENVHYPQAYKNVLDAQVKRGGNFYEGYVVRAATRAEIEQYLNPGNALQFFPGIYTHSKSGNEYSLKTIKVVNDYVPLRQQTNNSSKIEGTIRQGEIFVVLDETTSWYKVNIGNKVGWVEKKFTQLTNGAPRDMYQYLILSGQSGMTRNQLNKELKGKGILEGLGQAFLDGSKKENINEIYLLSHALLETGNGSSKLANGILVSEVDGKKVPPKMTYNMFGIGAYDWGPEKHGSERAYTEGWFTPEDAVIGGAHWIAKNYINSDRYKQNTLYKMRWNPATPGEHQYAMDVAWANKQTRNMNVFADIVDRNSNIHLNFEIPNYKNITSKIQWKKFGGEWYLLNREGLALTGWQERSKNWYYMKANGIMQTDWQRSGGKWYYLAKDGVMQNGWLKDKNEWYYLNTNGSMQTGWLNNKNKWYHLASNGAMNTGWSKSGGKWYYLNNSGVMQNGWLKDKNNWYYLTASGSMQTGWLNNKNNWYHLASNGIMNTGWQKVKNKWYYLNNSGSMRTGWFKENDNWYYLTSSGSMRTGWQQDNNKWYRLAGNGSMQTGWQKVKNKWYYLNNSGSMRTGWFKDNDNWYYLTSSGSMRTGWQQDNNKWYRLAGNGTMQTGWQRVGGKWYYLDNSGVMQTGWKKIDGIRYYLKSDGSMQTGWLKDKNEWYRLAGNGSMQTGWQKIGKKWYYFNSQGVMLEDTIIDGHQIDQDGVLIGEWKKIDNEWYHFEMDTKVTGWKKLNDKWYYLDSDGVMQTGWQEVNNNWYYLKDDGVMVNDTITIEDKTYEFTTSGVWIK